MFNIGDIVTVRSLKNIPPILSYNPPLSDYYYCISNRTLGKMSNSGNLYRISEIQMPAPAFDEVHEPVAYRLNPINCDSMSAEQRYECKHLYFLENMLELYYDAEEKVEAPDTDLSDFLFGGISR